jgi:hypothetical protein
MTARTMALPTLSALASAPLVREFRAQRTLSGRPEEVGLAVMAIAGAPILRAPSILRPGRADAGVNYLTGTLARAHDTLDSPAYTRMCHRPTEPACASRRCPVRSIIIGGLAALAFVLSGWVGGIL